MDPISQIPTPANVAPAQEGLTFPEGGEGLTLGSEEVPLIFPPVGEENLAALFPSYLPNAEKLVWDTLNDATQSALFFGEEGQGIPLPATFTNPPDIGLFAETDPETYPTVNGIENSPIVIVRGWPTYPGQIPQIGVAMATENEDGAQRLGQGGFAGELVARDQSGNIVASASYFAEPLYSVVVVELIHENRDERDRLHDMLRRRLYPLRHTAPGSNGLIKELQVQSEKTELPVDEQPLTLYVSLFTVEVWSEALITTEVDVNPQTVGPVTVQIEAV